MMMTARGRFLFSKIKVFCYYKSEKAMTDEAWAQTPLGLSPM
jgi:hypothetical protein